MIALSVKQPHASLLLGPKSIETRTWTTAYRGPLLICSGQSPDVVAMRLRGVTPATWEQDYPPGVALGIVHIIDVRPMRQADEVAACCAFRPGLFAWVRAPILHKLARPFPVRGQLGLFKVEVPKELWGTTALTALPLSENQPQGE